MYKNVYIAECNTCNKEASYTSTKTIPEGWVGFISDSSVEVKFKRDEKRQYLGQNSKSISSSCYLPEDSVFCSFECFEKFMKGKIATVRSSMKFNQ